jgi:hypothetical protein
MGDLPRGQHQELEDDPARQRGVRPLGFQIPGEYQTSGVDDASPDVFYRTADVISLGGAVGLRIHGRLLLGERRARSGTARQSANDHEQER